MFVRREQVGLLCNYETPYRLSVLSKCLFIVTFFHIYVTG